MEGMEATFDFMTLAKSDRAETDVGAEKMREALAAIAQEIQKFHSTPSIDSEKDVGAYEEVCNKLSLSKVKIKTQKAQIQKLRESLKTACAIAKSILSAKENENQSLSKHLTFAKNEFSSWMKKNDECREMVNKLKADNKLLNEKLQNISRFVNLGYMELQKIRGKDELKDDFSTVMKLKYIMICCGQYYADYSNEHEKRLQLEQRNRFLSNKLNILENNLRSTTEQLKHLQSQRSTKSNNWIKDKNHQKLDSVRSESVFGTKKNIVRVTYNTAESMKKVGFAKCVSTVKTDSLDLSSHLTLVKNLLNDQDTMLNDLKKLSEEMKTLESPSQEQ